VHLLTGCKFVINAIFPLIIGKWKDPEKSDNFRVHIMNRFLLVTHFLIHSDEERKRSIIILCFDCYCWIPTSKSDGSFFSPLA
jgi:hypothetical protein